MLTRMSEDDWAVVVKLFRACRSRRGDKGRNDRKFLEALHYFTVHNITWRALPAEFGNWNSVWKRFWRLSRAGVFESFFDALAATSPTAHLVQMFDSTVVRAHVSAAGAKGGRTLTHSVARAAVSRPRSTSRPTSMVCRSPST
jgi:transposase